MTIPLKKMVFINPGLINRFNEKNNEIKYSSVLIFSCIIFQAFLFHFIQYDMFISWRRPLGELLFLGLFFLVNYFCYGLNFPPAFALWWIEKCILYSLIFHYSYLFFTRFASL